MSDTNKIRLQKLLAEQGLGSRRSIEKAIEQQQITINGNIAKLGDKASSEDNITFNGKKISFKTISLRCIAYHKPVGQIVSHNDPVFSDNVFLYLPKLKNGKWIAIGRLDVNSEGLLLLTNNGDFAHKLMHPKHNIEREYKVRAFGNFSQELLQKMTKGVEIDGKTYMAKSVTLIKKQNNKQLSANNWFSVVLTEGRNREVRKLFNAIGLEVNRLIRTRFDSIKLKNTLTLGNYEELTETEINNLINKYD